MNKTAFLAFIEQQVNRLLALDVITLKRLQDLDGAVIRVHCVQPDLQCFLFFDRQGVRCTDYHRRKVTASITGSPGAFHELARRKTDSWHDIAGLTLSGDNDFLDRLEAIYDDIALDWEAVFCDRLGIIPGHAIVETLRLLSQTCHHTALQCSEVMNNFVNEHLQHKLTIISDQAEANSFYRDVQRLESSVVQLEERIEREEHLRKGHATQTGDDL